MASTYQHILLRKIVAYLLIILFKNKTESKKSASPLWDKLVLFVALFFIIILLLK